MSSSPNLEGLEIKEATPSIAPSIYESILYTKKSRILLALGIGLALLGICVLGFYLGIEKGTSTQKQSSFANDSAPALIQLGGAHWLWRSRDGGECLSTHNDPCPKDFGDRILLVVALGGLRPDQVSTISAFVEMKRCGSSSSSLVPSYPSFNLPNLYTIATGLYPEFHGIVSSDMHDAAFDLPFKESANNRSWWGGEPIWNTVNKQGKRSAAYLWPGSNVSIQARYPSYWHNDTLGFRQRMAKVLDWIKLPREERPHLIMVYYNEPAHTAQTKGIFSDQTEKVLREIGGGLDELLSTLHLMEIFNCVDLIILSDHGVVPFQCDNSVFVDDLMEDPIVERVYTGPVGRMTFDSKADGVHRRNTISKHQCQNKKLKVLEKIQIPKRYHYTHGSRIGDVVLDTEVGSHVALQDRPQECLAGQFGYNNIVPSMQGVFMAHGQSFKSNHTTESFRNVEIYNLMCSILDIIPSPNNGTPGALNHILNGLNLENSVETPSRTYLREVLRVRPNRVGDTVIGIDGHIDPNLQKKCQCDGSLEVITITTASSTPGEAIPRITEKSRITTTEASPKIETKTPPTPPQDKTQAPPTVASNSADLVTETPDPVTSGSSSDDSISPQSDSEVAKRRIRSVTGESKSPQSDSELPKRRIRSVPSTDKIFVKEDDDKKIKDLKQLHSPWGLPKYSAPEVSNDIVNILLHTNYILGFPESLNLAIWSSFTLTREHLNKIKASKPPIPEGLNFDEKNIKRRIPDGCWIADSRLSRSKSDQCHRSLVKDTLPGAKDFIIRQLYPEELETSETISSEGFLLSNVAAMKNGYERKGRKAILNALQRWTHTKQELNVVHGPIFDYDHDGIKDKVTTVRNKIKPPIPSHYFFVVTSCNSSSSVSLCPHSQIVSQAFVFPNTDSNEGCHMSDQEYLEFHLTSLADVESLSGLRLFRDIKTQAYARLKSIQHIMLLE